MIGCIINKPFVKFLFITIFKIPISNKLVFKFNVIRLKKKKKITKL